ncbi:MAG TPA: SUMF1/EgtB/PvdO family nonheme iron enzyme [Chloroflexia bacterium]|nr:SUMF1/EgtB/PvdO family nonheme iron enzyme [Chloroflexia bacterium]
MRRAFVLGSNGPKDFSPLQYAVQDAKNIRAALSEPICGFTVETADPTLDAFSIRQRLLSITEECSSEDTLVCYFSGHGFLEKGSLFLLLDNTRMDRLLGTTLPVSEVLQALRFCAAKDKLLILDCCHAGAVGNQIGLRSGAGTPVDEVLTKPDNFVALLASDRLESARELELLGGGFLTTNLCSALAQRFDEADKDHDDRISLNDLTKWLEERSETHNRQFPDAPVPRPYQFGQQTGGGFFFTLGLSDWLPHELTWHDGTTMVVLPFKIAEDTVSCIGKHPITNEQYRRYIQGSDHPIKKENYHIYASSLDPTTLNIDGEYGEPVGQAWHGRTDRWQGPFYPWRDPEFSDPEKPVVCVSFFDAQGYCDWVGQSKAAFEAGHRTRLPLVPEWELAAYGSLNPTFTAYLGLIRSQRIHDQASSPARIDITGMRANRWGISDMFGNVWEWCFAPESREPYVLIPPQPAPEVRGGGFLDNLSEQDRKPQISAMALEDKLSTAHSDLGFRIAGSVPIETLPFDVQARLERIPVNGQRDVEEQREFQMLLEDGYPPIW